jgi:hypothetical protein
MSTAIGAATQSPPAAESPHKLPPIVHGAPIAELLCAQVGIMQVPSQAVADALDLRLAVELRLRLPRPGSSATAGETQPKVKVSAELRGKNRPRAVLVLPLVLFQAGKDLLFECGEFASLGIVAQVLQASRVGFGLDFFFAEGHRFTSAVCPFIQTALIIRHCPSFDFADAKDCKGSSPLWGDYPISDQRKSAER